MTVQLKVCLYSIIITLYIILFSWFFNSMQTKHLIRNNINKLVILHGNIEGKEK